MAVVNLDTAARLDIICRRGDSFSLAVEFDSDISDENSGTAPDDGADDVWTMTIRTAVDADTAELSGDDADGNPRAMTVEVDTTDPKKLNITNAAANMATLDAGLYVYDVQRSTGTDDDNSIVGDITTYLFGTFEVRADVSEGTE